MWDYIGVLKAIRPRLQYHAAWKINFFGIMKNEMFYGHEHDFNSLEELEQTMVEYIEYYNKNRITTKLKGLSPLLYRQQSFNQLQY